LPARASGAESGQDDSPRFVKLGGRGVVRIRISLPDGTFAITKIRVI
jgi:hypothetical protein